MWKILQKMVHPQLPTSVQTDNSIAHDVITNKIIPKAIWDFNGYMTGNKNNNFDIIGSQEKWTAWIIVQSTIVHHKMMQAGYLTRRSQLDATRNLVQTNIDEVSVSRGADRVCYNPNVLAWTILNGRKMIPPGSKSKHHCKHIKERLVQIFWHAETKQKVKNKKLAHKLMPNKIIIIPFI